MSLLVFGIFILGVSSITAARAETDAEGRALISCELASNQRMTLFKGGEALGQSESMAFLNFCFASKIVANPNFKRELLKAGKHAAGEARKIDPDFRVTDWPGDT